LKVKSWFSSAQPNNSKAEASSKKAVKPKASKE
jgi:hypothetical protein